MTRTVAVPPGDVTSADNMVAVPYYAWGNRGALRLLWRML